MPKLLSDLAEEQKRLAEFGAWEVEVRVWGEG